MKNYWKNTLYKWNAHFLSILLILTAIASCSCDKTSDADAKQQERYIAVICKGSQHQFWKTVEQGAMDAGEELDITVSFDAPEDESQIDVQIDMMYQAIENEADAIVLAPLDTDALNDVIEEAVASGIPVLTLDSDVTSPARVATIGTSNETAGAIAARNAANLIHEKGKIAIIAHVEGAQTCIERTQGFVKEINENYSDSIEIVGISYSGGDVAYSKELALDYIHNNPDLSCIYATNEGCATGAAEAVEELGLKNEISVIGFDSSDEEIAYLADEVIDGMIVQNPYNMGYLGVRNLNKVLDGDTIETRIDTGATYVSIDNLYDEDTEWLLYPFGKPSATIMD